MLNANKKTIKYQIKKLQMYSIKIYTQTYIRE